MRRSIQILSGLLILCTITFTSITKNTSDGPYFGNGFRNGWADQHSVVIWTRLTRRPQMMYPGEAFLPVDSDQHKKLRNSRNREEIMQAQLPKGFTLDEMEGACPGAPGEVKITYFPEDNPQRRQEVDWKAVSREEDFTIQWKLDNLEPGRQYRIKLQARAGADAPISDEIEGRFILPNEEKELSAVSFCVVTCHDYLRRDDGQNGHKIYRALRDLAPDFYVHAGDIEYYDKPQPYALTEELMRFKWNRLFSLPNQRTFFTQTTTYFLKDDHDVLANDAYQGMQYGTVSFDRGLDIFDKEQFPANDKPYKTVRWGKDLQIWLLEGRNYRSKNTDPDGPDKTILGKEQKKWLFETIAASDATFRVVITPTPILGPDRKNKHDNYSNLDFRYEGDEIREYLNGFKNVFICNGDRHWQYVTHIEGTNLWEFSAGAGADQHAGGWKQSDKRPEHRFLRVKGGFLRGAVYRENGMPRLKFEHFDVDGNPVHEEIFPKLN